MANSIIDDMLNNQIPNKEKKSGSKIVLVLALILIIIVIVALVVVLILKTQNRMTPKDAFIQHLGESNIAGVWNLEKWNTLDMRMQNEMMTSTTEISGNLSSFLIDTELDLSELKIKIDSQNDPIEEKSASDVLITYKDNEIISLSTLSNDQDIGIMIKDVIIKYIGTAYSNLDDTISRMSDEESFEMPMDLTGFQISSFIMPQIPSGITSKYIDIINQKIPEKTFTSKEITLERASGNVNVTEYAMSINETQALEIARLMLQTLKNDDTLLDSILRTFESDSIDVKEMIKEELETCISSLYEKIPNDNHIYTIKVYGADDKIYKLLIDFYGEYSIDIDYEYKNNTAVTITFLETGSQNGFSIEMIKKVSDVTENLSIAFNLIEESEIVGKLGVILDLTNSGNSYTLKTALEVNYMIFNMNIQVNSQISFKEVEIDDLTGDNCVFLDELDQDNFDDIMTAVRARTAEIINENLVSQGEKPLIEEQRINRTGEDEIPIDSPEPAENEGPENPPETIDMEALKEAAKNKLITYISEAMTVAQTEGEAYTLDSLLVLQIPDSTFSVSIDGDVATLKIDGFEFKLNSEFQLYE